MPLFAGIEAGGTKFVCGVGTGPEDLVQSTIDTGSPRATLESTIETIRSLAAGRPLDAVGIACFGPICLDPDSPAYGCITSTPKPGWQNTSIVQPIREALGVLAAFDTDVNGALLGELRWGAARGLEDAVYLTVGTGIGGGILSGGRLVHGLLHPEIGHLRIPHDLERDPYPGCCPFHGDCWEGLACGPAIAARWGVPARDLPAGHPAWDLEAHYLALGIANLVVTLSPRRIILGGGVLSHAPLIALVQAGIRSLLADYIRRPELGSGIEAYVVPPSLGKNSGVLGAIALAERTAAEQR
jgi:fructokinase